MNGEQKEFIELTAELTARRLIEKLMKELPCDKQNEKVNCLSKKMVEVEVNHYNDINEIRKDAQLAAETVKEVQKSVNGLWWKMFLGIVVPLAIFVLLQKWI